MLTVLLFLVLLVITWSGVVLAMRERLKRLDGRCAMAVSGIDPVLRLWVSVGAAVTLLLVVSLRWFTAS